LACNLFFALRPDPDAAGRAVRLAEDLRRSHGMTARPVGRERLHMSLNPLGRWDEAPAEMIARACEAASQVRARPFVVALDRIMSFQATDRRPLVLTGEDGVIGALALYSAIHAALGEAGLAPRAERIITPHVTLLRDTRAAPEAFVEPVSWRVDEFVLIESWPGEGRHDIRGRWRLFKGAE
jgi:2'-5' RNA ligase